MERALSVDEIGLMKAASIHEAAHAVMAKVLGVDIDSVEVSIRDPNKFGGVMLADHEVTLLKASMTRSSPSTTDRERMNAHILVALAGPIAAGMVSAGNFGAALMSVEGPNQGDTGRAMGVARVLCGMDEEKATEYVEAAAAEVTKVFQEPDVWRGVCETAGRLQAAAGFGSFGRISPEQVVAIA